MRKKKRSMRKGKRQERPVPVNTHVCLEQDVEATGRQQAKGTGGRVWEQVEPWEENRECGVVRAD